MLVGSRCVGGIFEDELAVVGEVCFFWVRRRLLDG